MKKFNFYFKKNWIHIEWGNCFYLNITNPKNTLNKVKDVFKPLKCYFRFSKNNWYPILWVSPANIQIIISDVMWKDKYDTPRFECCPYIWIHIFSLNFIWFWSLSPHQQHRDDEYWEQLLWYLHYYGNISYGCNEPNLEKAKESWPWIDHKTKKSTWTDEFLIVK